jgi:hypothetical protein
MKSQLYTPDNAFLNVGLINPLQKFALPDPLTTLQLRLICIPR